MNVLKSDSSLERLQRVEVEQIQLKRLQSTLDPVLAGNQFYRTKLRAVGIEDPRDIRHLGDMRSLPFTTKAELSSDQAKNPPYGTNLTYSPDKYIRMHQTSGTTGQPLRWLDTAESWNWWARCWATVYSAAGVTASDRIFFAFSFGPFIGFWSAHEGSSLIGALAVSGGGMSSEQRVRTILTQDISVLVCTPTYALHLAEVAQMENLDISNSGVRITIHAGEPGASIPGTKKRIETVWGASCYDHAGATEVGAWGFECQAQLGLHLNEAEFICEIIDPVTRKSAQEGELVITNLGRAGMPVLRYRTGDRVRLQTGECECGRAYRRLEGGVIGRADDALIIRGVNIFPSSIEDIIRRIPEIGEFAVDVVRNGELDEMKIRIEVTGDDQHLTAEAVAKKIRHNLGLRVKVETATFGTLARFDLKAKRFVDHRNSTGNSRAKMHCDGQIKYG